MKRTIIIVAVALVVIGGSWYAYSRNATTAEPAETSLTPSGLQTVAVTRGPIEAITSATGSLSAARTQSVIPTASGKVTEVLVEEGQAVRAGQVLARLDHTTLELNLRQAEAALTSSQAQLDRVRAGSTAEDVAAAQAALISAQASLQDIMDGPSESELRLAQLAVDQAKNSLYAAQGSRDATVGSDFSSGGAKTQAEASVLNAEVAVQVAELQLAQLSEPPKQSAVEAARLQVAQAMASLARLQAAPTPEDLATSEAAVAQSQVAVDLARQQLDDADIVAPSDGELATWELHVGDVIAAGQSLGVVIDSSAYYIDLQIDEMSVADLAEGQDARIALDTFSDTELAGHISQIALIGTNNQGLITYGVTVALDPTDLMVRPLMTASVDIITDRKEGVLTVSNRALRRDATGKYVETVKNGATSKTYVETGVSNSDITEITSGLEAGDEVVVSSTGSSLLSSSPFGGD